MPIFKNITFLIGQFRIISITKVVLDYMEWFICLVIKIEDYSNFPF